MKFECGKCNNIFEVTGIKESVVTCRECGARNSLREMSNNDYNDYLTSVNSRGYKALAELDEKISEVIAAFSYAEAVKSYGTFKISKNFDKDVREDLATAKHHLTLAVTLIYDNMRKIDSSDWSNESTIKLDR